MKKRLLKWLTVAAIVIQSAVWFPAEHAMASEQVPLPSGEEETFALPLERFEICFEVYSLSRVRECYYLYFSKEQVEGRESEVSDYLYEYLHNHQPGLESGGFCTEDDDRVGYLVGLGYMDVQKLGNPLMYLGGDQSVKMECLDAEELLGELHPGYRMDLELTLPSFLQSEEGAEIPFSVAWKPEKGYKCFVTDDVEEAATRTLWGHKKDVDTTYDIVYEAADGLQKMDFFLWLLDDNPVKSVDIYPEETKGQWKCTSELSFLHEPSTEKKACIDRYLEKRREALSVERPESIASWRWEDGEKGTELILEHRMDLTGAWLGRNEGTWVTFTEAGFWKVHKTTGYKGTFDYSDLVRDLAPGFHMEVHLAAKQNLVTDYCNCDSYKVEEGVLTIRALEPGIDLDYEGSYTDVKAIAFWAVAGALGGLLILLLLIRILRSLRGGSRNMKQAYFCPACGEMMKSSDKICKKCGQKIDK